MSAVPASEREGAAVVVDRMRREDLEQILAIERRTFPTPWQRAHFEADLSNDPAYVSRVARRGDEVLGYLISWLVEGELHIGNLAVLPEARRQGIGELLVSRVLGEARRWGAWKATLEVRVTNAPAIALYRKLGFNEVAIRKGYYSDVGEDALVMLCAWDEPDGTGDR